MKKMSWFVTILMLGPAITVTAQNLFVADFRSLSIDEFTPSGIHSIFASGNMQPTGLAFDSSGNLFVSSGYTGGNIYKFTPNGAKSIFASGLSSPRALAFNSAGDLFEADWSSGNIYKFTQDGTESTFASGLSYPWGLAFDRAGNLLETDWGSGYIYKFAPDGAKSTIAWLGGLTGGLALDSAGNIYAGSYSEIMKISPDGSMIGLGYGLSAAGLAFDNAGNLFEADENGGEINKIAPSGTQTTFASGLYVPYGLAFQGVTLPVPEPSTWALLGMGVFTLLGLCSNRTTSVNRGRNKTLSGTEG